MDAEEGTLEAIREAISDEHPQRAEIEKRAESIRLLAQDILGCAALALVGAEIAAKHET